jgi:hypothetical protein
MWPTGFGAHPELSDAFNARVGRLSDPFPATVVTAFHGHAAEE